jgi:phosphoglucosamine mutase
MSDRKEANSIFGTSGIRRVFSNYNNSEVMFTPTMALEVGLALGTNLDGGDVVIARDIRTAAVAIEHALIAGLLSAGCNIKRLGIVTTPTLAMSLRYLRAEAGVVITASHNTPEYIGLKFCNPSGMGYSPQQEEDIERIFNKKEFEDIHWDEVGDRVTDINDINDTHILDITNRIMLDGSDISVLVDPGNGSGCDIVPKLLSRYGCQIMTVNAQMDGTFPGRHSEPSKENLEQISKFLKISDQEDIGIALDGDADRVIFLDENGKIVDPIRLLAILAKYHIEKNKDWMKREDMKIVTPINSSSLIEDVLNPLGCEVIRTEVGDIKVAIALKENGGFLGGENSGTYIWPRFHYGPDSIVTIAKVLQMMVEADKGLRVLLDEIPYYPFYRKSFSLKKDIPFTNEINQQIIEEMQDVFDNIGKKVKNINQMDGVRFDYEDGWILIRRSGTSPYLRISGESNIDMELSKEMNQIAEERIHKLELI